MKQNCQHLIATNYAFQDKSAVYLFTNENIYGTLKTAGNISGTQILTVGASGDHAFEAYLMGAKHVNTFDINSNQKVIIELKNHMIRCLPYADFMNFFFDKHDFFNQKILAPITNQFSNELHTFLKQCSGENLRNNFRYRAAYTSEYNIKKLNYIANEQNYKKLGNRLPEVIKFKHCNITTVRNAMQYNAQKYSSYYLQGKNLFEHNDRPALYADFREQYDIILLSNIFNYIYSDSLDTEQRLQRMYRNILAPLIANNTTEDGRVYFNYVWGGNPGPWVNFLEYFQFHHALPVRLVARTIDSAYHSDSTDIVMYITRRTR